MPFRTLLAVVLCNLVVVVCLYRWSDTSFLGNLSQPQQLYVIAGLFGVAVLLLWSSAPGPRIDPTGKAVFITGCDSGFGKELAEHLDIMGFQVFAGCLAPDGKGAHFLKESSSTTLKIVPLDVTDDFQVSQAVQFVKDNLGDNELWAVVNNAGITAFGEIEWFSVKEFMKMMDVNMFGVVRVTKGFLPLLRQSQGRVINVASLAGRLTSPILPTYSMSKKACIAFSNALRQEMGKFGITVVTIESAYYKTPMLHERTVIEQIRRLWDETSMEIRAAYGEKYLDSFLRVVSGILKGARGNTKEVMDSMIEAVCRRHPSHRYDNPYWKNKLWILGLGVLPVPLADRIIAVWLNTGTPAFRRNRSPKTKASCEEEGGKLEPKRE